MTVHYLVKGGMMNRVWLHTAERINTDALGVAQWPATWRYPAPWGDGMTSYLREPT